MVRKGHSRKEAFLNLKRGLLSLYMYITFSHSRRRFLSVLRNFFEMVRFDFILDSDLKVWLMEVTDFIHYLVGSR